MQDQFFLTIAHHLYLNKDERYLLAADGGQVDTMGICVPVLVRGVTTSEPAAEVVCRYRVRSGGVSDPVVRITETGFDLDLPAVPDLRDPKDGGCQFLYLTHQGDCRQDDRKTVVISYFNLYDLSVLADYRNG